jgi:hypothetical protein
MFKSDFNVIQKIGQYPSIASLEFDEINKYKKELDGKYINEFRKAIMLFAHGYGVASFTHIRRIFEFLIVEAAKVKERHEDSDFKDLRMDGKIKDLESELPEFLVRNRTMYSILSKGIHELEEKDCLKYFPIIKNGIQLILEEKIEKSNKLKLNTETSNAISKIRSDL